VDRASVRGKGDRHLGSPLQALAIPETEGGGEGFTDYFFVNLDEQDHIALKRRVDRAVEMGLTSVPLAQIRTLHMDAKDALPRILAEIHQRAWIFLFADIENPSQWPWSRVEALKAQGHESLDLYLLFPLHMALLRLAPYGPTESEALTRFYGCEDWKLIHEQFRITSSQKAPFRMAMEELYAQRLNDLGWGHIVRQRKIRAQDNRALYLMFFATDNVVGRELSDWERLGAADERDRGQGVLDFDSG
jgi:three-Cys-motif partner protein